MQFKNETKLKYSPLKKLYYKFRLSAGAAIFYFLEPYRELERD